MKKYIIGFAIALIALPAFWFGSQAYNDYRLRNCTPADQALEPQTPTPQATKLTSVKP